MTRLSNRFSLLCDKQRNPSGIWHHVPYLHHTHKAKVPTLRANSKNSSFVLRRSAAEDYRCYTTHLRSDDSLMGCGAVAGVDCTRHVVTLDLNGVWVSREMGIPDTYEE
jgi:hypothetical protein